MRKLIAALILLSNFNPESANVCILWMVTMMRFSHCVRCFKRCIHVQSKQYQRLIEVGRFETPTAENYQPGQFFLHRVFGYRGVVLFPWMAQVYDRETQSGNSSAAWEEDSIVFINKQKGETKPYYSVLIDHRDFPFIHSHPEAITFLGEGSDVSLYSIPGLDYVAHEDVLPYQSTGSEPFKHELFSQFLLKSDSASEEGYAPSADLLAWRDKNHKWLELMEVHSQETAGVRVTVMPFYMGRKELHSGSMVYWWRYNIRLENQSKEQVQLRERHWKIYSLTGRLETVKGKGVIGQEPVLTVSQPAFQYSSHVSLRCPSGHMWGTFRMERQDRKLFEVHIPAFSLESHLQNSTTTTTNNSQPPSPSDSI